MATVTLTGTIRKAPGAIAWANAPYKIRLVEGFVIIGGATRPPFTLSGEASALGAVSVSLDVPDTGTAHYELSIPGGPWVPAYLSAADTPTVEGWMAGAYDTPADVETVQALIDAALEDFVVGAAPVTSVHGRIGAVVADAADYAAYYAALAHTHAIAGVTGLQAALDGKLTEAAADALYAALAHDHDTDYAALVHGHAWGDITGTPDYLTAAQIAATYATIAALTAHTSATNNPHAVDAADVGLGSVANYAIASQAEAEAGSANDKYMTPLRAAQAIAALAAGGGAALDVANDWTATQTIDSRAGDVRLRFINNDGADTIRLRELGGGARGYVFSVGGTDSIYFNPGGALVATGNATIQGNAVIDGNLTAGTYRINRDPGGTARLEHQTSASTKWYNGLAGATEDYYMSGDATAMRAEWSTGHMSIGHAAAPAARLDIDAGAMRLAEMSPPSAPAANSVVLYAEDNGSGKTRLMARFATGAAQQVAIEP